MKKVQNACNASRPVHSTALRPRAGLCPTPWRHEGGPTAALLSALRSRGWQTQPGQKHITPRGWLRSRRRLLRAREACGREGVTRPACPGGMWTATCSQSGIGPWDLLQNNSGWSNCESLSSISFLVTFGSNEFRVLSTINSLIESSGSQNRR